MLRSSLVRTGVLAGALILVVLTLGLGAHAAPGAQDAGTLRGTIEHQRGREQRLSSTAARLGRLEASASRAVDVAQRRLADVQAQYDATQARLATTRRRLDDTRRALRRLRARLARGRGVLAEVLRAKYTYQPPGIVDVVLSAHGFKDLLERFSFLHRVQQNDTKIVDTVRSNRNAAASDAKRLRTLEADQQRQADAVARQREAMASMTAGLQQHRASLAQARSARLAALRNTRADRRRAEHALGRLEARQAAEARRFASPATTTSGGGSGVSSSTSGGGSRWAIPWAIVQCESGGQNAGPNSAGASGYYQFLPSTWKGLGGSTHQAYQASRAEQDRLAAKLWAGGAGAGNWDCAAIVGING